MHFEFALELSDIDLWDTDLLDTHLGLLNPKICIQISPVSILFVSIKSLTGLQDMSSIHVEDDFKTCLQDVFNITIFHLARGLQDVFKTSLQDVFKKYSRRLQDILEDVKLLRRRRVEDVLKTCLEDVLKTSSRPTNVCWVTGCNIIRTSWETKKERLSCRK